MVVGIPVRGIGKEFSDLDVIVEGGNFVMNQRNVNSPKPEVGPYKE